MTEVSEEHTCFDLEYVFSTYDADSERQAYRFEETYKKTGGSAAKCVSFGDKCVDVREWGL